MKEDSDFERQESISDKSSKSSEVQQTTKKNISFLDEFQENQHPLSEGDERKKAQTPL
jgi:hypothetical protein